MKKAAKWLKRILLGLLLTAALTPVLMYTLLFAGIKYLEWKQDTYDDPVEQALEALDVSDPSKHSTWADLTIDGIMTAFKVSPAALEETGSWEITSVTAREYANQLESLVPQAAFLLPDDGLVFDAKHASGMDQLAFYDAQTQLLIFIAPRKSPAPNVTKIDTLSVSTSGWMYELETHMGLFGDGATFRAFIEPEAERPALQATLSAHADWHTETVSRAEYVHLHNDEFYGVPALYPTSDIIFDYWGYVDTFARAYPGSKSNYIPDNSSFPAVMQEAGARPSGNWLVTFYDADTGLFIYYQYDS